MLTKIEAREQTGLFGESSTPIALSFLSEVISIDPLQIRNITGLGPVKSNISTFSYGVTRGESFNKAHIGKRNIVLTVGLNPNWVDQSIESLRALLYEYFMTGNKVILRFFSTHLPTAEITGYIESFETNIFSKDPEIQISIICPDPDFVAISSKEVVGNIQLFNTTSIDYEGTAPTGFNLLLEANATNVTYTGNITVKGVSRTKLDQLVFSVSALNAAGYVFVNTVAMNKNIYQSDSQISLLKSIIEPSTWPQLYPGENTVSVNKNVGGEPAPGQDWTLTYFERYGGL